MKGLIISNKSQIATHLSDIGERKHVQEAQAQTAEMAESVLAVSDLPYQEKRSLRKRGYAKVNEERKRRMRFFLEQKVRNARCRTF